MPLTRPQNPLILLPLVGLGGSHQRKQTLQEILDRTRRIHRVQMTGQRRNLDGDVRQRDVAAGPTIDPRVRVPFIILLRTSRHARTRALLTFIPKRRDRVPAIRDAHRNILNVQPNFTARGDACPPDLHP